MTASVVLGGEGFSDNDGRTNQLTNRPTNKVMKMVACTRPKVNVCILIVNAAELWFLGFQRIFFPEERS